MNITSILRTIVATAIAVSFAAQLGVADVTAQPTNPCVSFRVDDTTTAGPNQTSGPATATTTTTTAGVIQDGTVVTAVVTLDEAYASNPPSEVEISAPGLQCGRTKFTFVKGDRSSYTQRVTCRTDAGSAPATDGTIVNMPLTLKYKGGPRQDESQVVQRRVISTGKCSGAGDPHLLTLDGVAYDFQNAGVFRLFESNNLQVQVVQEKCGPVATLKDRAPSCYQGVSVALGASIVRFVIVDGKIAVGKASSALQMLSVEKLSSPEADGYRVFTSVDQATFVDINLAVWQEYKYPYLNVALQVSPYFKNANVAGLMGNWNGNRNDDVTDSDKLVAQHGLALTDNLFTCVGDACTPKIQTGSAYDAMALNLANALPMNHQGYVALAADAIPLRVFTPTLSSVPRRLAVAGMMAEVAAANAGVVSANGTVATDAPVNATAITATTAPIVAKDVVDVSARATELCRLVITSLPACATYVHDVDFFITRLCVGDATLLSDLSVVDSTKLIYLRACRRELDARLATKTASATETKTLLADRASLFFGDVSQCAKNCSGRGQCLAAGCQCSAGFTGHGCDVVI